MTVKFSASLGVPAGFWVGMEVSKNFSRKGDFDLSYRDTIFALLSGFIVGSLLTSIALRLAHRYGTPYLTGRIFGEKRKSTEQQSFISNLIGKLSDLSNAYLKASHSLRLWELRRELYIRRLWRPLPV